MPIKLLGRSFDRQVKKYRLQHFTGSSILMLLFVAVDWSPRTFAQPVRN